MMRRALYLCIALVLAACGPDEVELRLGGETMGTTYNIVAVDRTSGLDPDEVHAAVKAALTDVNAKMSNWDRNSEISRFNASESTQPYEISNELAAVVRAANEVHDASQGQFDVTLGPLIELWGFGDRQRATPVPSDNEITDALGMTGQRRLLSLQSEPSTLTKHRPDTTVYLAAIAKGYGVDKVAATLESFGLTDYMVEIGGDLFANGTNPHGNDWRIGIERPDSGGGAVEQIIDVTGFGMATSGDYRNYFEEDGVRYSHIIDPSTGRPITHVTASVTVLTENAMLADAWATALLVLGEGRGMDLAEQLGLAVLFITRDMTTEGLEFVSTASSAFEKLQAETLARP